ncbi:MAG: hypothetical protein R6U66_01030 [Bacteroidales bacterium]
MKKPVLVILVFCTLITQGYGQEIPPVSSAYAIAMGGTGLSNTDYWSVLQNAAVLPATSGSFIGGNYSRGYIQEQGRYNLIAGFGTKRFALSSFYQYYGYSEYHSQSFGLTYGQQLAEKFTAGVSLHYHLASMPKLDKHTSFLGYHVAVYYQLSSFLSTGIQFQNPTLANSEGVSILKQQQGFRMSLCYQQPDKVVKLQTHLLYLTYYEQIRLNVGLDLRIHEQWRIQAGSSTEPFTPGFGFTWASQSLHLAFSSGYHPQLGFLPSVSFAYVL